ncbi:MAG: hypothetical protein RLZ28_1407 [Actinomycetota bacterium]
MLALIAAGGVSGAWLVGVRTTLLAIPTGLLLATVARILIFSTCNLFGVRQFSTGIFYVALAATLLIAAFKVRNGLYRPLILSFAASLISVFATRVLGLASTRHGDSYWILSVSHLMQNNGDMLILDGHTPLKRGFAYPLLLALGPQDQALSGITPYIFFTLVCAVAWLVWALVKNAPRNRVYFVGAVLAAMSFTAPVTLRSIFYINGHTLLAVSLVLVTGIAVLATRDQRLSNAHLVALCAAVYVATSTRAEGVALAAIVILPLVSLRFLSRGRLALIITSLTSAFAVWQATYASYLIPNGMPWFLFMAIVVAAGLAATVPWFDWLRFRAVPIGLIGLTAIFVGAEIKWHAEFERGHRALLYNLVYNFDTGTLGSGGWGLLFVGLAVILGFVLLGKKTVEFRLLLAISAMLVLGSLISKMLDGGQFGDPDLGRIGWSDSLNRMWIQSFGIFVITVAIGLIQKETMWLRSGAKNKGNNS